MLPLMVNARRNAPESIGRLAIRTRRLPLPRKPVARYFASSRLNDSRNLNQSFGTTLVRINGSSETHKSERTPTQTPSTPKPITIANTQEEQNGAWILLSALEKAKEAELVTVARMVARIENTLLSDTAMEKVEQQPPASASKSSQASKSNSSSFVSLPDVVARAKHSAESLDGSISNGITGDDVRTLLQATRHGKLIDLPTVVALIEGVTLWLRKFRPNSKLVQLPPLAQGQTLTVIGDLHGSLRDLATVLEVMPGTEPHDNNLLLFNGDLADRGDHGIETIGIVCALCLAYPQYVYVNRGNHEDLALSVAYGLVAELRTKYGPEPECLTRALDAFFRSLPLATIVEKDALIVHGGPPPPDRKNKLVDLLASQENPVLGGKGFSRTIVDSVGMVAPHIREGQEVIEALLWSDPWVDETGRLLEERDATSINGSSSSNTNANTNNDEEADQPLGWHPNPSRGAGNLFDVGVVRRCLQKEGLTRMVRSHEQIQKGCKRYKIPAEYRGHRPSTSTSSDRPMELFTVFSASRYPYKEGFNQGAVLELHPNGKHKVHRYSTEDDDPIVLGTAAATKAPNETEDIDRSPNAPITLESIREHLFEAIYHHEGAILLSLQEAAASMTGRNDQHENPLEPLLVPPTATALPLDRIVDILIQSLKLEGDSNGWKTPGAKGVLVKALEIENVNEPIDLELFSNSIVAFSRQHQKSKAGAVRTEDNSNQNHHHQHAQQPTNGQHHHHHHHNGHSSPPQWVNNVAVASANGSLSSKAKAIEGIDTQDIWRLLNSSRDGSPSGNGWEPLGDVLDDSDTEDDALLEG